MTILRWTGRGRLSHLEDSVRYVLRAHGVRAEVSSLGGSVAVRGPEPIGVAALLQHLPGVSWIAAGYSADSAGGMAKAAELVARSYVRRGGRFAVEAEATLGTLASDAAGAVTSRILEVARGARVSEAPKVKVRVAVDGEKGAVGAEVRGGEGGVPTGDGSAACLVSGGVHSSVVAWMSVLAGFKVRLLHVKVSEQSVLAVARLYSELSNRADPRGLSVEVVEGGSVSGAIAGIVGRARGEIFAGFHAGTGSSPTHLRPAVTSPLFLMPEEGYLREFKSLGIRPFDQKNRWVRSGPEKCLSRSFSGGPADVSAVIDGLS